MIQDRTFIESLKMLEADIQHANTLVTWLPKDSCKEGYYQLKLSYSPVAPFLLFLVKWTDCSLAGMLGLIHVIFQKVHFDGSISTAVMGRRASLNQFYGNIYPSLMQLNGDLLDDELVRQKSVAKSLHEKWSSLQCSEDMTDTELFTQEDRELECGICLEENSKITLPLCFHTMCSKCYQEWSSRDATCPFCRRELKATDSEELWVFIERHEVPEAAVVQRENADRLLMAIEKLPIVRDDPLHAIFDHPLP